MPSAVRHTRTARSSPPLMMTGVRSGSVPAATAYTRPSWPVSGSPTGVLVGGPPHPHRTVVAVADDDRGTVGQHPGRHRGHPAEVGAHRLVDRGAVGGPPHPHRTVAAAADDDRGAVRQRPGRHRGHPAGVAGYDLVAGGPAAVGPAGLPWPVGGGAGDAGSQAAAAQAVRGQLELAGPHGRVEVGEEVGALPVHGGGGPRRDGSRCVEVGTSRAGSTVIR